MVKFPEGTKEIKEFERVDDLNNQLKIEGWKPLDTVMKRLKDDRTGTDFQMPLYRAVRVEA